MLVNGAVVFDPAHPGSWAPSPKIGGTPEETHYYLGPNTVQWTLGIATDQTLPLGPRVCQ